MDTSTILLDVAIILVCGRAGAELAAKLNAPRVIGELCAGIIIGPSLFGWVLPSDAIALLAEIGIILLLFEVGLETDFGRLISAGRHGLSVAVIGFVAPALLGFGLSYYTFDLPLLSAFFVAGTLTATSIGITVRILSDLGQQSSREGQIVLGAAVVDDILGVIVLAVLYDFATRGQVNISNTVHIIVFVAVFFIVAPIVAKVMSGLISRFHSASTAPGVIPVALVSLVLASASAAHAFGAPELLGGFAAGIALSRRFFLPFGASLRADPDFHRAAHEQMKPIIQLFTPIFFVMVGLSLDLSAVDWSLAFIWMFSLALTAAAIAGKLLGGLVLPINHHARIAIGMAMVPRGEVGLIFAEVGRTAGIFDATVYTGVVIVIAYTTLLSPFWIRSYYRIYGDRFAEPVGAIGTRPGEHR